MLADFRRFLSTHWRGGVAELGLGWKTLRQQGPSQLQFWLIALVIGVAAGMAAVGFRVGISVLQDFFYGASDKALHSKLSTLHWAWVLGIPIAGGLAVGLFMQAFSKTHRPQSLADVIEGAALREGQVDKREGIVSTIVSLITLSTGGSTGREGPVVHMGAVISTYISGWIKADGITARDLMGCAAAAAVSASFNAPIAGTLFALEVVLRHFAVRAFAPIVIASVAGTLVSRWQMGNVTEFVLPINDIGFYVELPAFLLLGLVCGVVAFILIRSIFIAEEFGDLVQSATHMPDWLRPAVTGALLGTIAIWFPHIIGVGYETTSRVLTGQIGLWLVILFVVVKIAAVAITFSGRMGGGIFSPSLMVGAMTGLAFGYIATAIAPELSGAETLYALAGMGAVAAAVLGAPISTTLIVFELTGDWQAGVAVMVSVSLASALNARLVDRSYFLTLLKRRGVRLAEGPQSYVLGGISTGRLMRAHGAEDSASEVRCFELMEQGVSLPSDATLERAFALFDNGKIELIPITAQNDGAAEPEIIGALFYIDALRAYNRALAEIAREEHS